MIDMRANEYQRATRRTVPEKVAADKREMLINGALGLCGEAGEVADLIKKHLYQGHTLNHDKVIEELGDVLWYISMLCGAIDVELEHVMRENIEKLKKRYPDGFSAEKSVNREEYKAR